jgi:tryptophanyl-tRNA synthetase
MTRVFSGIQPTGDIHLGNYLGALRQWVPLQHEADAFYAIVDLHALTVPQPADEVADATSRLAQWLFAIGLDPQISTVFAQSALSEHNELAWLLECTVSFGELRRMGQFKDKSDRAEFISGGLFTYPALQAADILLYDTDQVPVGDDQRQHLELTRTIAERFNSRHGETFVVPETVLPAAGARVMDLQHPDSKMSKSSDTDAGTVMLTDAPSAITKKFKRAVTDSENDVRFDPINKPGVSNLLNILGAATGNEPESMADDYDQYGPLKTDAADAVIALLEPLQARYCEIAADPAECRRLLSVGADKARSIASVTLERARNNVGLLPR